MFAVSVFVIAVVLWLCTGQVLPYELNQIFDSLSLEDGHSDSYFVALGFGAGMLAALTPARLLLRYFATVVHELGHALTAGALLARPRSIFIHPSSSGLAMWEVPPNWGRFRAILVSAAGYPAPSLAALAAVNAIDQGRIIAWSFFSVGVLSISVVMLIRNLWGLFWTTGVVVASYFLYQTISVEIAGCVVAGVAGFLTINSVQFAWIQYVLTRRARGSGVDAESIEGYTGIPASLVALGHLGVTLFLGYLSSRLALRDQLVDITSWVKEFY